MGSYTFANNSSTASNVLSFAGGISGGTTNSAITLNLSVRQYRLEYHQRLGHFQRQ